jgi:hypothetical protein
MPNGSISNLLKACSNRCFPKRIPKCSSFFASFEEHFWKCFPGPRKFSNFGREICSIFCFILSSLKKKNFRLISENPRWLSKTFPKMFLKQNKHSAHILPDLVALTKTSYIVRFFRQLFPKIVFPALENRHNEEWFFLFQHISSRSDLYYNLECLFSNF